jgi:ribosomal protein L12E/L44/L45/RPP1/RPP2
MSILDLASLFPASPASTGPMFLREDPQEDEDEDDDEEEEDEEEGDEEEDEDEEGDGYSE